MTRRDHPELKCIRCGVSVKEEHVSLPNRCPAGERCPLNVMVAAGKHAEDKAA